MKKTFGFILLIALIVSSHAQNKQVDSLLQALKQWQAKTGLQADTNLYNIYYKLGISFQNNNPDTAIYFLNKSVEKAQQLTDKLKEAESTKSLGKCFFVKSNYPKAMKEYEYALKLLTDKVSEKSLKRKQEVQAAILGNIGNVYLNQGDYAKALDYYFKALKIFEEIGNKNGQAANLGNIGIVYNDQGDYAKALDYYFKALKINEEIGNKNGQAANLGNIGIVYLNQGDYAKALDYYFKALKINEEIGNKQNQAANLGNIGMVYYYQGNYAKVLDYYFKALKINEEIGNKKGQSNNLGNIGIVYYNQGNYVKALDYYFKALKINEEIGNKHEQAGNLGNIGLIYSNQGNYAKSLDYYFKALKISEEIENKQYQASNLGNIGIVYKEQSDYAKALDYYFKSLKIDEEIGNKRGQAIDLVNIGSIYREQGDNVKSLDYYFKALKISEEIGDKQNQAISLGNIGSLHIEQRKYKEAEQYLKQAIKIGEEVHDIYHLEYFYNSLSELYTQTDRHKEALEAYKTSVMHRDSVMSEENQKASVQKEMQFEFEKKQAEDSVANAKANEIKNAKIAQQQAEIKAKRNQQYALYGGLVLVILFAGFVFNRLKVTQKQKTIIEQKENETQQQNILITEQKLLIEEKHKDIVDSITYAKRIQQAILPNDKQWYKTLPNSFVLYQPKDIVAGDFYWLEETEQYIYIAAADCTGHGVPGAMVSVVCSNALTKAVLEEKQTETNTILDTTRAIVLERLGKSEENIQDGMDVCLVRINKNNRKDIQYSGANRPLFIITTQNELQEIKPDKQPIGKYDYEKPFTVHSITLNQNDILYLITDGYADQFGGEHNKKFSAKSLRALLLSLATQSMEAQKDNLLQTFLTYRNTATQTDDVTVIGVRV